MAHKYFHAIISLCVLLFCVSIANAEEKINHKLILQLKDGQVVIQLRPDIAPKSVAQVEKLAQTGRYDHVIFHRVIAGFMAQTGDVQFGNTSIKGYDPERAGMGGSNYPNLPAEFSNVPFVRGTVAMARAQAPDSGNSQFFICFSDAPFLNNQYTVIGQVVSGMDVVDKIKKGDPAANGAVQDPDEIIKATIE